jgi:hypothetical protein
VNGTEHKGPNQFVTFEQLVNIAFPNNPHDPNITYSITFEKAESKPHQGTLAAGTNAECCRLVISGRSADTPPSSMVAISIDTRSPATTNAVSRCTYLGGRLQYVNRSTSMMAGITWPF